MKQKCRVTILSISSRTSKVGIVANKIDEEYDVGTSNDISVGRVGGAHLNIVRIRVLIKQTLIGCYQGPTYKKAE